MQFNTRQMKQFLLRIAAAVAVCISTSGCLHHSLQRPPRTAEPVPESFRKEFGADATSTTSLSNRAIALSEKSRTPRSPTRWYAHYEIAVTNAQVDVVEARPVEFDYFLPNVSAPKSPSRSTGNAGSNANRIVKLPAILILPIMGGTNYDLEAYFARSYAKRGFAVAILHRPDIKKEIHELEDIDVLLRRSVRDAQKTIDWLEAQPEIDPQRLGLFGISMGAIRGTMVLALDERVRAGVLGLVGGDVPYILAHTREKSLVRERNKVLDRLKLSPDELEQRLRRLITCEPFTVAPAVDPSRVLMVIAAFDHVIPARQGWELRRKLGNPETVQLFSGHYSSVVYAPWLKWRTARFFEKKLGKPERPQHRQPAR